MVYKKSFKDNINPAMQFISQYESEQELMSMEENISENINLQGLKANPAYIEVKSRRLQLLVKPSVYAKIKEKAKQRNQSINNFINMLLEDAVKY